MTDTVATFSQQFLADDRLILLSFTYLTLLIAMHRFTLKSSGFARITLLSGAAALLMGYALLIPLNACAPKPSHLGQITSLTLNFGWLCLGLGLFIHVRKHLPQPLKVKS